MNIEANIKEYVDGVSDSPSIQPFERYASFDYCFNYFQSFRERKVINQLFNNEYLEKSCLQLGYYLASWGMLRGSTYLLQKSVRAYEPIIKLIAGSDPELWDIDANTYSEDNIERILDFGKQFTKLITNASDTLITKVMLGVFGNVPAFDTLFKKGFKTSAFGKKALKRISSFYQENQVVIETARRPTIDFITGNISNRFYPRAKIIDMIFYIEGTK